MAGAAQRLGDWQFQAGAVLRAAREALGWSLPDAARYAGLEEAHVRAIEAEAFGHFLTPHVAAAQARAYAAALGVSEAWVEGLVRAEFAAAPLGLVPPAPQERGLGGWIIAALRDWLARWRR